jgi:hypothetical protein
MILDYCRRCSTYTERAWNDECVDCRRRQSALRPYPRSPNERPDPHSPRWRTSGEETTLVTKVEFSGEKPRAA